MTYRLWRNGVLPLLLLVWITALPGHVLAAAGDLDTSFGTNGIVNTDFYSRKDIGYSVAVQSDGKIVLAGKANTESSSDNFALVRYTSDGTLDSSFGVGGKQTLDFNNGLDVGSAVTILSDGKILLAGKATPSSAQEFAVARFTSSGMVDTSFGTNGKATTSMGTLTDEVNAVGIQSDGSIVIVGAASNGSNRDFALARFTSTGALDTTFNSTGKVLTNFFNQDDYGKGMAIQSDDKIVVAGYTNTGTDRDFALARYTSSGAQDTTFGTNGLVHTDIGSANDYGYAMALQSDGKIVVAGRVEGGSNVNVGVTRYTSSGVLDTSFGTAGKVNMNITSDDDMVQTVAIQSDGKILVGGYYRKTSSVYDIFLARFTSDGTLDTTFGTNGKVTTANDSRSIQSNTMAIQSDGNILVGGYIADSSYDFALARYLGTSTGSSTNPSTNTSTAKPVPSASLPWLAVMALALAYAGMFVLRRRKRFPGGRS